jgi:hypothetical protein
MARDVLRIVYVVGSSHSGSTLLAFVADAHPEVASVGETAVKPGIRREARALEQHCSCGAALAECPFWKGVFTAVSRKGQRFDVTCWSNDYRFENVWLDSLLTRETSREVLLWFRRAVRDHWPAYRSRAARVDRVNVDFVSAVLAQTGKTVFLDTTKLLTRLTHLLAVRELDVKVVRLVRDVRAFAASAKRRGASTETAAEVWRKDQTAIARALDALPRERVLLLRYEDLCAHPRTSLDALWAFCGVAPFEAPPTIHTAHHHIIGNSMRLTGEITIRLDETWRTRLDAHERRRILSVAGPMNRAMGYA